MANLQKLSEKFFTDPDWAEVEGLIREYINPLLEMDSIDTNQSAETVKAEIIGRTLAYNTLDKFLRDSKVLSHGRNQQNRNTFK